MSGQETNAGTLQLYHHAGSRWPVVVLFLFVTAPAFAANGQLEAGQYELKAYTVMPHLEEMRRITRSEQRCIGEGDVTSLFPVMRQTAFRGCALVPRASDAGEYDLRCQTELVATGLAVLRHEAGVISATLAVKMGGKNMTFSQHTAARFVGPCTAGATD